MELSLNTYEKTDEQKKRLSESIFNSTITENNTPINAIRRVVVKKKKKLKAPAAPGINGVIHEDPEAEDDEYEEVEVVRDADLYQVPPEEERIDAQVSSEGENQKETNPRGFQPPLGGPHSDDSDEGNKDPKKKDKKDKKGKKDTKPKGHNEEELRRGTKLMANPGFKNNLDRLRSQFKTQATGQPASKSSGGLKLKPRAQPEETAFTREDPPQEGMLESKVIQHEEYRFEPAEDPREESQVDRGSDIKLGDRDHPTDLGKNSLKTVPSRGLKDSLKASKKEALLTPNINPDPTPAQKKADPAPPKAAPEADRKPKQAIQETQPRRRDSQEDFDVPLADPRPVPASKPQASTKDSSSLQEDWGDEPSRAKDPQPKKVTIGSKQPGVSLGRPGVSLGNAQKKPVTAAKQADGSDNSWDESQNPYK